MKADICKKVLVMGSIAGNPKIYGRMGKGCAMVCRTEYGNYWVVTCMHGDREAKREVFSHLRDAWNWFRALKIA